MDKFIFHAFQNLPDTDVPASLHASIMRATIFRRVWKYVSILTFIIALTFTISLWHLYTRMLEAETLSVLKAVAGTFELSITSIKDSATTLFEFLPVQSITLSVLNFIAFIFMVSLLRSFMRLEGKFAMQK